MSCDRGERHLGQGLTGRALDRLEQVPLARGDERQRVAGASRATGATDAVDVGLGVGGDVVVEDVADPLHVEPARGHVGGDQDVEAAVTQLVDGAFALGLGDVAVDRRRREAPGAQALGEHLGGLLRADEDDHALEVLDLEDPRQGVELLLVRDLEVALGDVRGGRGLVLDRDLGGVGEVLLRDPPDLRRHGRGEQRDVLVRRRVGEDRLDVLLEAHLEHLVGLVEDEEAELGEVEGALLEVVHDPAGRPDDHVHPTPQRGQLDAVGLAAVDRQHVQPGQVGGVALERLRDLQGELAGGREDEGLRAPSASGRSATGSAPRRPRSCPSRSARDPPRADRRAAPGSWPPGSARATRSRRRSAHAGPACRCRGRRRSASGRARRTLPRRLGKASRKATGVP